MIRLGISCLLASCCHVLCYAECITESCTNTKASSPKKTLFSEIRRISVTPVICGNQIDKNRILQVLDTQLANWGKVISDDPKDFGQQMSVLQITIGPIAQLHQNEKTLKTLFPVVQISMQLLTKAALAANPEYAILGLAWEQTNYVNQESEQLNTQIETNLIEMLKELREKYVGTSIVPSFSITSL